MVSHQPIAEVPEEHDKTSIAESRISLQEDQDLVKRAKVIKMFKQIDQAPLTKICVPKAQLAEESIP